MQVIQTENEHGSGTVRSWASILEPNTLEQAKRLARHPLVQDPVALMPDAHVGRGATVGCVTVTRGGIIPSVVGVDIGCGMEAVLTDLRAEELTSQVGRHELRKWLGRLREAVPAGVGQGHEDVRADRWDEFLAEHPLPSAKARELSGTAAKQFGTLGSGNHFLELSPDETGAVWLVVHSGSRGIGNQLAQHHQRVAQELGKTRAPYLSLTPYLEDPELAPLLAGTPEFQAYIDDMLWAQAYARANRQQMVWAALDSLPVIPSTTWVSCHHNYSERLQVPGEEAWLSRKGAIAAGLNQMGILPGSMGTDTYLVAGLGNELSYRSAPHGAGRVRSRGAAKRELSVDEFQDQMAGRIWQDRDAQSLLDEAPDAYKPIGQVIADSLDLVRTVHRLQALVNYKGVDRGRGRKRGR